MRERMGNNREPGPKGEEGVKNYSHGNELGKKIMRGSRVTLIWCEINRKVGKLRDAWHLACFPADLL